MNTKSGFLLRAVGDNDTIVTSLGVVDKGMVKIIGLSIANGLWWPWVDVSMHNSRDSLIFPWEQVLW